MDDLEQQKIEIDNATQISRRNFFKHSIFGAFGAATLMKIKQAIAETSAQISGTELLKTAPEIKEVHIGFMPLTDCAPVIVASKMGFDKKYGIKIMPEKQASWAAVRDKLLSGELYGAHILYGMMYGVQMGVGCTQKDMAVLMSLSNNGQGITLSNQFKEQGVTDGKSLKYAIEHGKRQFTFAQTFPTGTHAMWLYYWLAAHGINPMQDVNTIVVPPPQMSANMQIGNMDGFCVGEPWNVRAIVDDVGFSVATSQDIWPDHPEKVLGCTAEFVANYPNTALAMTKALLEACRYIDVAENRTEVAKLISDKAYTNTPEDLIAGRFAGNYENGLGQRWQDANPMKFFNDGKVNYPYLSDGMWFLTQQKRWGLLKTHPDYLKVAEKVNRIDLYTEAAKSLNIAVPASPMRTSTLIDGIVWNGSNPADYADSFEIKV